MRILISVAIVLLAAGPVKAQILEELRLGIVAHDVMDHAESGPQISFEAVFVSPDMFSAIGAPRPYLYSSVSTQGYTNLIASGLSWTARPNENWSLEASLGLSWNDGVDDIVDLPADDPYRIRTANTRALLGSDALFHSRLGVDYALSQNWSLGAYYEHFSHGQILAKGRNQALDELGLRLTYRFDN